MSSVEYFAVCGCRGCGKIMSAMPCEKWETWYHEICIVLCAKQYDSLKSNENAFICIAYSLEFPEISQSSPSPEDETLKKSHLLSTDDVVTLSDSTWPADTTKEVTNFLYKLQLTTLNNSLNCRKRSMQWGIFFCLPKQHSIFYRSPKRQSCRHPKLYKTHTKEEVGWSLRNYSTLNWTPDSTLNISSNNF